MQKSVAQSKGRGSLVTPQNAGLENAVGFVNAALEFIPSDVECTVLNVDGGVCIQIKGPVHSVDGKIVTVQQSPI